jgi:hypothetical protein
MESINPYGLLVPLLVPSERVWARNISVSATETLLDAPNTPFQLFEYNACYGGRNTKPNLALTRRVKEIQDARPNVSDNHGTLLAVQELGTRGV